MQIWSKIVAKYTGSLFSSQDSKYFLVTAAKITAIPLFFFCLFGYSIWNLMELNFNFFVAHDFHSGDGFKESFYDAIFGDISYYIPVFTVAFGCIYLIGLVVAWLALRPFGHIQKHISMLYDDPDRELEVKGLNKNKLLYQAARIFFKYIQMLEASGKAPAVKLPPKLENLNQPVRDKVFLFQYAIVTTILCFLTSALLFAFSSEFYNQIVDNSNALLEAEKTVSIFISQEIVLLEKIRAFTILGMVIGYIAISFNIIKSVDGVSYGFSRDMLKIVTGQHAVKLHPRQADPGKDLAFSINELVDEVVSPFFHEDITNDSEYEDYTDDLPPTFIEETEDKEGNKVFQITTPKGLKIENLNENMALKLVMDLESQKKAS